MSKSLSFEEVRRALREEAREAGLRVDREKVLLDLDSLERTLTLDLSVEAWSPGSLPRAGLALTYRPGHQDPAGPDDDFVEIDVEYLLVASADVPLAELEPRVRPHVAKLHAELGGEPPEVYFVVATDYAGSDRAVEAKVVDVVEASVAQGTVFSACLGVVAAGLRAVGVISAPELP